ncbi:glycosyltransferase family 2 protein [Chryseobacterium sp.]|uniref:glycosyltransferase family 2 protein n=1 Tax=Chryseobacterium sp. TaxID=1871047 RepID=UPI003890D2E2
MSPLVTIVVVCYNHSKYIKENLESIKSQTYPNIQLIVADDASPDNSVEVFEEWLTDNNYPALKNYHKKNKGLATTLNECIELAKGKYIKLIAADDCLEPTYIEKCIDQFMNSTAEIVFTNASEIDDNGVILSESYFKVPKFSTQFELENLLLDGNFISGATLMTTRSIYATLGPYNPATLLEDYNLILRALKKNLFVSYIPENLIHYRRHENNITLKRFHKLEVETIKEKILFDKKGRYADIIHSNIKKQVNNNNPEIKDLKYLYIKYKSFDFKFYIIHFYSKLYSFFKA